MDRALAGLRERGAGPAAAADEVQAGALGRSAKVRPADGSVAPRKSRPRRHLPPPRPWEVPKMST